MSSSPDKFPAGGVLAPHSLGLIHKRTLLTLHRAPHPRTHTRCSTYHSPGPQSPHWKQFCTVLSIQEHTPRTGLTIPLDQTHLIEAALHLSSQAPPSSPLAVHLLTSL
ncbi:hypothetical protein GOODEAATRI_008708 [Goodea atripinnis]|uniref:Uncharacterized protein n=1 Tax=Goodea atripinnis TaxID=208336 RepID=A0ABV0PME7_9TELE